MRMTSLVALVLACMPAVAQQTVVAQPQPNVVVLPPAPDYLGNFIRSLNDKAEREKQREHEIAMQREWLAAQQSLQQQIQSQPRAETPTLDEFILKLTCDNALPPLRQTSTTLGYFNGRFWAEMTVPQRLFYVEGLSDMLTTTRPPEFAGYNCNCTIGEFVSGITEFYKSDTTFQVLPITFAMLMHAQRAKGETPEQIAARARGYLKYLAAAQTAQR